MCEWVCTTVLNTNNFILNFRYPIWIRSIFFTVLFKRHYWKRFWKKIRMILEKLFDPIVPTTIQKVLKWRAKKVSTDENVIVMLLDHDLFQNVVGHWFKNFGEITKSPIFWWILENFSNPFRCSLHFLFVKESLILETPYENNNYFLNFPSCF